jgi:transcriptional regulator with XRE-family HTH domain
MSEQTTAQRVIEEIRVELFRNGISQKHVAKAMGKSSSWISRRLNGAIPATIEELDAFALAAGASLSISLARGDRAS